MIDTTTLPLVFWTDSYGTKQGEGRLYQIVSMPSFESKLAAVVIIDGHLGVVDFRRVDFVAGEVK